VRCVVLEGAVYERELQSVKKTFRNSRSCRVMHNNWMFESSQ
jgi:hypothetical protein